MKLEHIAFLGRTYQEYLDMFGLKDEDLREHTILDCPAGPSSFAAEALARGFDKITAADPCYWPDPEKPTNPDEPCGTIDILKKAEDDLAHVFDAFDKVKDNYVWTYYDSKDQVISLRKQAMELFAKDYEAGLREGRYVEAALPKLPFADNAFTMAISGHFLFLYSEWLSIDAHLAALRELLRVASKEVRVYPLATLEAKPYDYLGYIITTLEDEGIRAEVDPVGLEFIRGGGRMLKLTHK